MPCASETTDPMRRVNLAPPQRARREIIESVKSTFASGLSPELHLLSRLTSALKQRGLVASPDKGNRIYPLKMRPLKTCTEGFSRVAVTHLVFLVVRVVRRMRVMIIRFRTMSITGGAQQGMAGSARVQSQLIKIDTPVGQVEHKCRA